MRKKKYKLLCKRSPAGLGLFAGEDIKKGEFLIEYHGPIISEKKAQEKGGKYLFEISSTKVINGSVRSNKARYINHSCIPNCETDVRCGKVLVFSRKNIKMGEELAYDYGKEYFNEHIKPFGCRCVKCLLK